MQHYTNWQRRLLAGFALAVLFVFPAAAEPRVVVSILPLHSLVASVMEGVGAPVLLMQGAASPHSYTLRPSAAKEINAANLIFWIGPDYETFLVKPIAALGEKARAIDLNPPTGATMLRAREGGDWGDHAHSHGPKGGSAAEIDPHTFLNPLYARSMVGLIWAAFDTFDPANRAQYRLNASKTEAALAALDREIEAALAPVKGKPFIVFHDGYQYLEQHYGLNAVGTITVSPDRPPGAKRLRELRHKIAELGAVCVFAEPQFNPALVRTVVEGTKARVGMLDYLGAGLTPGPAAYGAMMRGLARSLVDCLKD